MDSMRTLGTSLPVSPSKSRQENPPENLLQAFRSAALSVTTLYKTAASEQTLARQAGYQEALDHLLAFLDKEELGFGDGEGWRVRQWATERLEGGESGTAAQGSGDSEDEKADHSTNARSVSPAVTRKDNKGDHSSAVPSSTQSTSPQRTTSAPPTATFQQEQHDQSASQHSGPFTFRSSVEYPQPHDTDMDEPGTQSQNQSADSQASPQASTTPVPSGPSVRLEVIPRPTRNKRGNLNRIANRSSSSLNNNLGARAGAKRRLPFEEFFDIRDLGSGKDNHGQNGGPKRGRHS